MFKEKLLNKLEFFKPVPEGFGIFFVSLFVASSAESNPTRAVSFKQSTTE